jgi:WD40 repeat protein
MSVRLWSFPDMMLLHSLQDRKKVVANVRISPNGEYVCAASYGGRVAVWSLAGEQLAGFKAGERNMASLAISPDSSTLAVAGLGEQISIWQLPTGRPIGRVEGHKIAVLYLGFIQDGRYLVSLGQEGDIIFWDTRTWQQERITTPDIPVRTIAFDRTDNLIALSSEGKIQIRRVSDWQLVVEVKPGARVIPAISFSPDGHWLAVGAADKKIRVWEILP